MPEPGITLVDPEAVRVGRVIDEGIDRIVTTYEVTYEGEPLEVAVAVRPEAFISFIVASLSALGFPEGDCQYIAERYERENPA